MKEETIAAIKATGLKVYMRKPKDTWLYFTDGTRIGYLQEHPYRGVCTSSVHVPNGDTGTGFQIDDGIAEITFDNLARAFCIAPSWAFSRYRASVVKFRSMDAFINSCMFNRDLVEV